MRYLTEQQRRDEEHLASIEAQIIDTFEPGHVYERQMMELWIEENEKEQEHESINSQS